MNRLPLPVEKWNFEFAQIIDKQLKFIQLIYVRSDYSLDNICGSKIAHDLKADDFESLIQQEDTGYEYPYQGHLLYLQRLPSFANFFLIYQFHSSLPHITDFYRKIIQVTSRQIDADIQNTKFGSEFHILHDALDKIDTLIWVKDDNGCYSYCNQAFADRQNSTKEEVIGHPADQFFDSRYVVDFNIADRYVFQTGRSHEENNYPIYNKKTKKIERFNVTKTPIFDRNQKVHKLIGVSNNVTEQSQLLEQLSLTAEIFDNCSEGMLITDKDKKIIRVNKAYEAITGYREEEVLGTLQSIFNRKNVDKDFFKSVWKSLNTRGIWRGELMSQRKDGSTFPQCATINTVYDEHGEPAYYFGIFTDISLQKKSDEKLHKLAFYHPLTNLPNRAYALEEINRRIEIGSKDFVLFIIEVDQFKTLNDSIGYQNADQILLQIATRLVTQVEPECFVAHLTGNEFLLLGNLPLREQDKYLEALIAKVQSVFIHPFSLSEEIKYVHLTSSIGIALYPHNAQNYEDLIRNANSALNQSKDSGRNTYTLYKNEMSNLAHKHLKIRMSLREAIELGEFNLVYQPQFSLTTPQKLVGFEALLRWTHNEMGFISPADFIPVAEKTGFIVPIGDWVLNAACKQAKAWLDAGYDFGRIAVNVSALQLQQGNFYKKLRDQLIETGLPAQYLEIEITEGVLLDDPVYVHQELKKVRELGIEVALDDFGTGYSSLSYLKGLPVDKLKIDRSFILDIPENPDSNNIVKAIIALADSMKIKVIVEGIETKSQQDALTDFGCGYAQGFYLGRPMDSATAQALLNKS